MIIEIEKIQLQYKTYVVPIILNSMLFFRLTLVDLLTVTTQYHNSKSKHEKNIIIRNLAVHLYEFFDDTKDFLGPKMKDSLKGMPDEGILTKDLYSVKSYYKALKDIVFKSLMEIRNNSGAHKEQNAIILRNKIDEIDNDKIIGYLIMSMLFLGMIIQFQNNVINSIANLKNQENPEHVLLTHRRPENIMREGIYLIRGVEPILANYLSDLTAKEIEILSKKLVELKEYLETKNNL